MTPDQPKVGELLVDIKDDVRKVIGDELEMGGTTIVRGVESAVPKLGVALLGACIALIGLAMLCVTLAFAFRAFASPAICTLIAAVIYIVVGGAAAAVAAKRLGAHHQQATVH